jgi:hypothetical protein
MKTIINNIINQMKKYGIKVNNGALKKDIIALETKMEVKFPADYVELLTNVNGLEFNGVIIYSVDGTELIQPVSGINYMNETWKEMKNIANSNLLVWAEDDMNLYVYDFEKACYKTIGKYGNEVFEETDSILGQLNAIMNLL